MVATVVPGVTLDFGKPALVGGDPRPLSLAHRSRGIMLSATAAAGPATKTRMGKAEASEPRMQEARVTKAEVSEAWTEKATAEPAVPTSAKSDGNSDRPSPAP